MVALNARLTTKTSQGGIFRRRRGQKLSAKTNSATQFLGAVITLYEETAPDCVLCPYDEVPAGILMELADDATDMLNNDAQGLIDEDVNIKYANPSKDDEFLACLYANYGCVKEHICVINDKHPGYVQDMDADEESIAAVPPFRILGKFMETVTKVNDKAQYVWVKAI